MGEGVVSLPVMTFNKKAIRKLTGFPPFTSDDTDEPDRQEGAFRTPTIEPGSFYGSLRVT